MAMYAQPAPLTDTKRFPSRAIWQRTNLHAAGGSAQQGGFGIGVMSDFIGFHGTVTTNVGTHFADGIGWKSFEDTSSSILMLATEQGGVVRMLTDNTDNADVNMQSGGSVAGMFAITAGKKFAWEARIRPSVISTQNLFIGLAEEGLAVNNGFFSDAGAIVDKDYIGFRVLEADPDGLDFAYNTAGGSEVVEAEVAQLLVASTWYKVGMYGDGKKITGYVNGASVGSFLYTATGVPDGEELCLSFCSKNGTTTARNLDIDWVSVWAEVTDD